MWWRAESEKRMDGKSTWSCGKSLRDFPATESATRESGTGGRGSPGGCTRGGGGRRSGRSGDGSDLRNIRGEQQYSYLRQQLDLNQSKRKRKEMEKIEKGRADHRNPWTHYEKRQYVSEEAARNSHTCLEHRRQVWVFLTTDPFSAAVFWRCHHNVGVEQEKGGRSEIKVTSSFEVISYPISSYLGHCRDNNKCPQDMLHYNGEGRRIYKLLAQSQECDRRMTEGATGTSSEEKWKSRQRPEEE